MKLIAIMAPGFHRLRKIKLSQHHVYNTLPCNLLGKAQKTASGRYRMRVSPSDGDIRRLAQIEAQDLRILSMTMQRIGN
ncbi:hypothetical protein HW511_07320 [Asaia siamensis]|uniref:hypothetical protein n=1 Tax=Asaia siamensis TaxID=110479 RepID=UPI001663C2BF|nr:hypothetical protein [Asaia siamensis]